MKQQQKEQVEAFVRGMVLIDPVPAGLSPRMRYQRQMLAEVTMFWPNIDQVAVVEQVIGPVVGELSA